MKSKKTAKNEEPKKGEVSLNILFPAYLAEKLEKIGLENGLDHVNTLRYLVATYELKSAPRAAASDHAK
ncbi:hypothetical protein [Acidobacterium sp. S8]|uniref:hypothetical protein n=1 Tax=Acidobacterium sp. S8 TaxID=1641854 RepID=UPI001576D968|nr:hypothetical protein [Acidobacterium sp. S8]